MENINVQENHEVADMAVSQVVDADPQTFLQTDAEVGGDPIEAGTAEEAEVSDSVTIH